MTLLKHRNNSYFYFDRISVNTEVPRSILIEYLPIEELNRSGTVKIKEAFNTAKYHGYNSRIELYDATDDCIDVFSKCDLGKSSCWHIEIAKDIEFENIADAKYFLNYIENSIQKKWESGRFHLGQSDTFKSLYIGKKHSRKSRFYFRFYIKDAKDNPFGDKPVFHFEFVLEAWSSISKKLNIEHISELGKAKELFEELEQRYIRDISSQEINRERLRKNLIKAGVKPEKANHRAYSFYDTQHFKIWAKYQRSLYYRKIHKNCLNRTFGKKAKNTNSMDRFFLDRPVSYYLMNRSTANEKTTVTTCKK